MPKLYTYYLIYFLYFELFFLSNSLYIPTKRFFVLLSIQYVIPKYKLIERKTYKDFTASITDKRLFTQINEMKKYQTQYLIIEGFDFSYKSRLHQNAIRGAILSIAKQIPIIYTENEEDTAKFLIQIAKRYEKPSQEFSTRQTKSNLTLEQQKQFILEGFPGVGPVAAKKLVQEFGSLKNIFNTTQEQLEKIFDKNKLLKFIELLKN